MYKYVKFSLEDLNLDPCPPHSTNTYTCKVTIMPKVRGVIVVCEGPFLDGTQAQVKTRILGPLTRILCPLLVILVDCAWFTAAKWGLIANQFVRKSHKAL